MNLSDLEKQQSDTCHAWLGPSFSSDEEQKKKAQEAARVITAERLQAIQDNAYEDGFQSGLKDGLAESKNQVNQLQALITMLAEPLRQLDDEVEAALLQLSVLVAKQLIRRELKTDPEQIVAVIKEAVALLPLNARKIKIKLNPLDVELVQKLMQLPKEDRAWKLVDDPMMTRGGCEVLTNESRIDASVESRMNTAIATLFGEERSEAS